MLAVMEIIITRQSVSVCIWCKHTPEEGFIWYDLYADRSQIMETLLLMGPKHTKWLVTY
ncbi:hypothetical protein HanHA300_Chr08g0268391 [Helianthus annuus]|nr:hypothetical protein HanHA300_Chr08g0268391 [Helianthus annuus]KAJ0718138.1 hypothetical protein HanLR1_Chr08g0267301 [Helianthus annuus]KAJ0721373.1 hypothetical protein HanOQP8_Chr08g0274831 [Helianthus annuus]